jgi:predicted DNA-binding protein (MmcQ/YjbR family)
MDFEHIRDYCLSKKKAEEDTPFGPDALVYKVCGKMFALLSFDEKEGDIRMNLKNAPEINLQLREDHSFIIPGYHMNKSHWNTIIVSSSITKELLYSLIDQSYDIVVAGLPKKVKAELAE